VRLQPGISAGPHSCVTTRTTRTHRLLAAGGLTLLIMGGLGCTDESAHPPMDDVDPAWTCSTEADGVVRATGSVTNHSSKSSFYIVTIDFAISGRSFGSATSTVDEVAPGETVVLEAAARDAPTGEPTCVVSDVERFKA
jgi:hypothetical protein